MAKPTPETIRNSIAFNDRALVGVKLYEQRINRCVCALFMENLGGVPERIGSGVLTIYRDTLFIFSSAHVVEQRELGAFFISIEDETFAIEGEAYTTLPNRFKSHKSDRLDCLVIRITSALPAHVIEGFICEDEMMSPSINCVYLAAGFPLKRFSAREKNLVLKQTFLLTNEECFVLGLYSTQHVAVHYEEKMLVDGKAVDHKSLEGISGGALFMLHGISSHVEVPLMETIRLDLVAIIVEKRKRTSRSRPALLCTSIGCHTGLADQILEGSLSPAS